MGRFGQAQQGWLRVEWLRARAGISCPPAHSLPACPQLACLPAHSLPACLLARLLACLLACLPLVLPASACACPPACLPVTAAIVVERKQKKTSGLPHHRSLAKTNSLKLWPLRGFEKVYIFVIAEFGHDRCCMSSSTFHGNTSIAFGQGSLCLIASCIKSHQISRFLRHSVCLVFYSPYQPGGPALRRSPDERLKAEGTVSKHCVWHWALTQRRAATRSCSCRLCRVQSHSFSSMSSTVTGSCTMTPKFDEVPRTINDRSG